MRKEIYISDKDILKLNNLTKNKKIYQFNNEAKKVFNLIQSNINIKLNDKKPSYWKIENDVAEHNWHYDTGSNDHMDWCEVSGIILLNDPNDFEGGELEFDDGKIYTGKNLKNKILIYTSKKKEKINKHRRKAYTGQRNVMLFFLGKNLVN